MAMEQLVWWELSEEDKFSCVVLPVIPTKRTSQAGLSHIFRNLLCPGASFSLSYTIAGLSGCFPPFSSPISFNLIDFTRTPIILHPIT